MIIPPGILLILHGAQTAVSIPVRFGAVVSVNLSIGTVKPPFGVDLMLIACFPPISMFLVHLFA